MSVLSFSLFLATQLYGRRSHVAPAKALRLQPPRETIVSDVRCEMRAQCLVEFRQARRRTACSTPEEF